MHDCSNDDGGCSAENCCRMTCAGAEVTCPSDKFLKEDGLQTCQEDCEDHTPGIQTNCGDFCGEDECCEEVHVPAGEDLVAYCAGEGNCASALTDTSYEWTYEQYSDADCTQSQGMFGGAPISGTTATCTPGTYNSGGEYETPLGFFAYCTADGQGIYEYISSTERCPPGIGGGEIYLIETVGECICFENDSGTCEYWHKMTCSRSSTSGSPPPPCVTITADEVGAITDVTGTWTPTGGDPQHIAAGADVTETGMLCPAAGTSAPYYHMPSLEDLQSMTVTEAPVSIPVTDITPQVLDGQYLTEAANEVFTALTAPPPAPDAAPPPPPREIKSTIAFPIPTEDVAAIIEEDSQERASFETGFKTEMAASLGGGNAVTTDDIIIDAITSGSVNVAFHIEVPAIVTQAAADMVASLDASTVEVTVGGQAIAANEIEAPTVAEIQPQDCSGVFSQCTSACLKTYKVTTVQSGIGEHCVAPSCADPADCIDGEEVACRAGEGDCPVVADKTADGGRATTTIGAFMAVLFGLW